MEDLAGDGIHINICRRCSASALFELGLGYTHGVKIENVLLDRMPCSHEENVESGCQNQTL